MQLALLRAWSALCAGVEVQQPQAWLHQIVRNVALTERTRHHASTVLPEELEDGRSTATGRHAGTLSWAGINNTYYWIDREAGIGGRTLPYYTDPRNLRRPLSLGGKRRGEEAASHSAEEHPPIHY